MTEKTKRLFVLLVVFGLGLGIGTAGGYVLNDVVSREDPNTIQQIRQELEQQQRLDDFFTNQEATQTAGGNGSPGESGPDAGSGAP